MSQFQLTDLDKIIAERAAAQDGDSWTVRLLARGTKKVAEKFGEEAVEAIVRTAAHSKTLRLRPRITRGRSGAAALIHFHLLLPALLSLLSVSYLRAS